MKVFSLYRKDMICYVHCLKVLIFIIVISYDLVMKRKDRVYIVECNMKKCFVCVS